LNAEKYSSILNQIKQEFTVTVELGATGPRMRIDFKKYGLTAFWIESRNGGDGAYLAIDTVKPYLDKRHLSLRQHPRNPWVSPITFARFHRHRN
jgi:hypothetical protein